MSSDPRTAHVVDVRPISRFVARRLKESVSFELSSLGEGGGDNTRATELPSRSWPLKIRVVGATGEETGLGLDWLETRGWAVDREKSTSEDAMDWEELERNGLVESGVKSAARFWRASPPLERECAEVEKVCAGRVVLDLGCGSGRDAVFLANRGWKVIAVDKEKTMLEKLYAFAERQNCADLIEICNMDLRPQFVLDNMKSLFTKHKVDAIHMSRFMNRPLLGWLAFHMQPNTCIIIHHFLVGATSRNGKPFSKGTEQTLQSGELRAEWFPPNEFDIIMNEESCLADGRPVVNFIARRR